MSAMDSGGANGISRHEWEYRPLVAFASDSGWLRGKHQVSDGDFKVTAVELCVCARCGTRVATNTPAMAQRVANVEGIDCDDIILRRVMES